MMVVGGTGFCLRVVFKSLILTAPFCSLSVLVLWWYCMLGFPFILGRTSVLSCFVRTKEHLSLFNHPDWQPCCSMSKTDGISIWQHLRRCHDMSLPNTPFWKWSNGVKRVERDLFWCISMTNNVKSYKKINGRAQTSRFSVFTRGRQELCAENAKNYKN